MERRATPAEQSTAIVAALALLSAAMWTLVPALTHLAPPLDVVEGYMWGREWPLITYKHPALPAWVIEASRVVSGGAIGWPVYLASQLFVLAILALIFLLARDMLGNRRALLATLPLLFFEHLAWRSPEFNHAIAQMPFWLGVVLFAWRASDRGDWISWLLLAIAAAGGVYAKLSHGVIVATAALWFLWHARGRQQFATPKPWLAAAVAFALLAPLAIWFARNGTLPLEYARSRAAEPSSNALTFLLRAAITALPMLLVLALAALAARKDQSSSVAPANRRALSFVAFMAAGPLALSILAATVSGSGLRTTWAAPMLMLLPLLLVLAIPRVKLPGDLRPIATILAVIIVLIPIGYGARLFAGRQGNDGPTRANWPERQLSDAAAQVWQSATDKPLRIVAGDTWPAGLVGIRHPDRPSILTAGDLRLSPWITPERLARDGALVVFEPKRPLPDTLKALIGDRQPKPLDIYADGRSRGAALSYVIIPPRP